MSDSTHHCPYLSYERNQMTAVLIMLAIFGVLAAIAVTACRTAPVVVEITYEQLAQLEIAELERLWMVSQ